MKESMARKAKWIPKKTDQFILKWTDESMGSEIGKEEKNNKQMEQQLKHMKSINPTIHIHTKSIKE